MKQYEELKKHGEKWVCDGDIDLILIGMFKGISAGSRGVGLIQPLPMDTETQFATQTVIEGLSTRVWAWRDYSKDTAERQNVGMFEITPTTEALTEITPVKGTYSILTIIPNKGDETAANSEQHLYQCQRFTRLGSMTEQDGPWETWTLE